MTRRTATARGLDSLWRNVVRDLDFERGEARGQRLLFGARFLHLSNADQEGPLRNPCIEAAEVYCGVMVKL